MKHHKAILLICLAYAASAPLATQAQDEARAAWQVTSYDISVQLPSATTQTPQSLDARVVVNAKNVGGTGRTFTVRLAPEAEIRTVTVGGQATTFTKREDARTKLQQASVALPASVAGGGNVSVAFDYRLPVERNTGLAALSVEGAQFLPISGWYPTPNTQLAPRGADTAPYTLTVRNLATDQVAISGGAAGGDASGRNFRQTLHAQPFFATGRWTTVEGTGAAQNVSAHLYEGADADERRRAEESIKFLAGARAFVAETLGMTADVPLRLVAVRRGAGFDGGGTILVDAAAFRRDKLDAATALAIAEGAARTFIGGLMPVRGEGGGALREGLVRHLALTYIEQAIDRAAAETERARERAAYAPLASRDAPLAQLTPAFDSYYSIASVKGAMVWRLIEATMGRELFVQRLRGIFAERGADATITLTSVRAKLIGGAAANDPLRQLIDYSFDQPSEMDLLVGVPTKAGAEQRAALRNTGAIPARVNVAAHTAGGAPLMVDVVIPAKDFGEARFPAGAVITRVEVDPLKLYPQLDYANDTAPKSPGAATLFVEATQAYTRSDFAAAEARARAALALAPRMSEARITLARALLAAGKSDEAEREFRLALDDSLPIAPTIAWAHVGIGEILLRRGQAAEAAQRFDSAVRADAEYAATLQARDNRIRAEAAARTARAVDESARLFVANLDTAIKSGRKADIDALILPGELATFSRGLVGSQPEIWTSEVRRTESLGGGRIAVDVRVTARILGKDQAGTAVYVLTRTPAGLRLADVQLFEVR